MKYRDHCSRHVSRMHNPPLPPPPPWPPPRRTEPMVTLKLIIYCQAGFAGNGLLWVDVVGCQLLLTRVGMGVR